MNQRSLVIAELLNTIIDKAAPFLPEEQVKGNRELVEYNEAGVALENLCQQLNGRILVFRRQTREVRPRVNQGRW